MTTATVCFDEDCGLCRWGARRLRRWDRHARLRFVALGDTASDELLHELSPDGRRSSWHLVGPDGQVSSGGAAVPRVLELLPGGRPLAAVADRFPGVTDRLYRWVADRRERIGGHLGQHACAADPRASRPSDVPA
jgi:predicted DCC family thiol-disulfide oxidoreductase YuxK